MISKIALLQAILNAYRIPGIVESESIVDNTIVYKVLRQPDKGNTSLSKYAIEIARQLGVDRVTIKKLEEFNTYGIVAPYRHIATVEIDEILGSPGFTGSDSRLPFAVGKDAHGDTIIGDLASMPHLLVGGGTDFGRGVFLDSIIISLLRKFSPAYVKLLLISPCSNAFSSYSDSNHLYQPVITGVRDAVSALDSLSEVVEKRYATFGVLSEFLNDVVKRNRNIRGRYDNGVVDTIQMYNAAGSDNDMARMAYVAVIIDEFSDLMRFERLSVERAIAKLGTKARAAGVHLVLATSSTESAVITDTIKTYCPSRVAFKTADAEGSRTVLDRSGAEGLLGGGDMLYQPIGAPYPYRVQGAYISTEAVSRAVGA